MEEHGREKGGGGGGNQNMELSLMLWASRHLLDVGYLFFIFFNFLHVWMSGDCWDVSQAGSEISATLYSTTMQATSKCGPV